MGGGGLGIWSESDHVRGVYEKHLEPTALAVNLERNTSRLVIVEDRREKGTQRCTSKPKRVTSRHSSAHFMQGASRENQR